MDLKITNPNSKYAPPAFQPPPPWGYLHIAASVAPLAGLPFVRRDARQTALLAALKPLAADLQRRPAVRSVTVYRGVVVPPTGPKTRRARYDVAVLIETTSPNVLDEVRAADPYRRVLTAITEASRAVHVLAARCVRSLGEVDRGRPGLFLFNHFTAENPEVAVGLWEHLAGWYAAETALDNSTLLEPIEHADHVLVNHARWDKSLWRLAVEQLTKTTFRSYVVANLRANNAVALPVLYRLA